MDNILSKKKAPELKTEPVTVAFHITADTIMGILSLLSGFFLLVGLPWVLYFFILAMDLVIYAVVNSAGYYGQRKQWAFVTMFGINLIISVSLVILKIISHFQL